MSRKKDHNHIPTFDELFSPTLAALLSLGGSASVEELNNKVYEITKLPNSVLQTPHGEKGTVTEIAYRLAWSRTYLKKFGLLENSSRGIWVITKAEIDPEKIDREQIKRLVREQSRDNNPKEVNPQVICLLRRYGGRPFGAYCNTPQN